MYTRAFWDATWERARKTFIQSVVALTLATFGGEVTGLINVLELDWSSIGLTALNIIGTSVLAAGLSALMSLKDGRKDGNPSSGNRETVSALPGG